MMRSDLAFNGTMTILCPSCASPIFSSTTFGMVIDFNPEDVVRCICGEATMPRKFWPKDYVKITTIADGS